MLVYLDTTALGRLASQDDSSTALLRYLGSDPSIVSCRISEALLAADPVLDAVAMRELDRTLLRGAAEIRSTGEMDIAGALHLAAALELRRELEGFVTYDDRIATAARALRLPVVSPT